MTDNKELERVEKEKLRDLEDNSLYPRYEDQPWSRKYKQKYVNRKRNKK